jgi:hypothetical protein
MMLPAEWSIMVANHHLWPASDLQGEALRNMLVFPLSDTSSQSIEPHEVTQFLASVSRELLGKSVRAGFVGRFYAWLDEMSGVLCVAERVGSPLRLTCPLRPV